ncbi:MAG: type I-C CRISPR-associated protein Cas5c [Chloroflexota bacterium]|nr:type I-C CRISPR-associated protein Cas5c [Dehalococcoidia bacterium]MDW8255283.1 type I-C CRISPR-associated protein Cas5c [Chloroflexota bacterium]
MRSDSRHPPLAVKVWGEFACFTRPEMKVERVSYPVMTPSAARGVLEAIFWKPEFVWRVEEIWVLKEVRWFSIRRNEVNSRASHRSAQRWEREGGGYFADEDRAQRHTLALRDVAYVISAQVEPKSGRAEDEAKFRDQFRRRVAEGRCFFQPYLGCREFAAFFGPPSPDDRPIDWTEDLGLMLRDLEYREDGSGTPRFFRARLEQGVLRVPAEEAA